MMIPREFVGKQYPPFTVELTKELCQGLHDLIRSVCPAALPASGPPLNWPAILTLHGTACLLGIWEDLRVDPLAVRLEGEEFEYERPVRVGEELTGQVTIESITRGYDPQEGIVEHITFRVELTGGEREQRKVAVYRCRYRHGVVAVAGKQGSDVSR